MNEDTARFLEVAIQDGLLREDEALYLLLDAGLSADLARVVRLCRRRYAARLEAFNRGGAVSFRGHAATWKKLGQASTAPVQDALQEVVPGQHTAADGRSGVAGGVPDNVVRLKKNQDAVSAAEAAAHLGHIVSKLSPAALQRLLFELASWGLDVSSVPACSSADTAPRR